MPQPDSLPDIHFGSAEAASLDWRKYKDDSPDDDEELEHTPPSIVAMLGFDPREAEDG
jgi:hypothetical protein